MAEKRRNQQNQGQQAASRQPQQSQSGSGQQGDQSSSRQPQQFETSNRQQGGGGSEGRFADQIQPHQEVVDQNGAFVGTVDHVDGDRIKLTRTSSGDGQHHFVPLNQVAGIEGGKIRLQGRGDASFGQEAGR
jgi:hypothetical protein